MKKELELKPDLHYKYLMKSNPIPPKMILSIHGTAISRKLDGGYEASKAVKEQIYRAAESGAWITTSGMKDPLKRLIGSARVEDERKTGDKVPIIGFPFFEDIKEKNVMKVDGAIPSSQTSSLDKNHSQFLMFEGKANPENPQLNNFRFHVEMKFRDEGVPVANILVSGDLNSLKSIILRPGMLNRPTKPSPQIFFTNDHSIDNFSAENTVF